MNVVQQLHREAMDLAEEAVLEQAAGNGSQAKALFAAAFKKEREAAESLEARVDLEPTRSILFRSAATLALDCGDHRAAEKLIARALTGNPPPEIAEELRDLLENVNFQRHLDARGIVLESREFQMSITGNAIGLGVADSEVFIGRVQDLERLVYRTAERKANRPFRDRGRRSGALGKEVAVFLSAPRASSFAVTFRLGYSGQMLLPGMDSAESVIEELLQCIDVVGSGTPDELEKHIPDPAYRRNFLALTRRLAPDGDAVKAIGFTAAIHGAEKRVVFQRTADQIPPGELPMKVAAADERVVMKGTLKYADSTKTDQNQIKIVDADDKKHTIIVPEGMMDDIVRPLWEYEVEVIGVRQGRKILLSGISRATGFDSTE